MRWEVMEVKREIKKFESEERRKRGREGRKKKKKEIEEEKMRCVASACEREL